MAPYDAMFRKLAQEKASGSIVTLKDWLKEHPPPSGSFRQTIAGAARQIRRGEPFPSPVRDFLDEFALIPTQAQRQAAIDERPPRTGDRRYDAYLAAIAEHLAAVHGLRRPQWVCEPHRFLDRFWFPADTEGFRALAIAQSPAAFRRRSIFITAASLKRV